MKKLIAMLLSLVLVFGVAACASTEVEAPETNEPVVEAPAETPDAPVEDDPTINEPAAMPEETPVTDDMPAVMPEETPEVAPETPEVAPEALAPNAALNILNNIWGVYGDDEKFAIYGGNMENAVMDAPGAYNMDYAEGMTFNLLVPAEQLANVTEAASMIHMMNANTFTCGVFRLADGVNADEFASAMEAAVMGNMWMCGFPETLVIANVDGHILMAFGVNDAMNPFIGHLTEAYPDAAVLYNQPIA